MDHHNNNNKTPPMGLYSCNNYSFTRSHKNCTEGLGFESSDEVEDIFAMNTSTTSADNSWLREEDDEEKKTNVESDPKRFEYREAESSRKARAVIGGGKAFPPPISCLSKTGKPRVCFKSYREDGRFVLKEIRVRSQEFLHACREDGRLKLHFVQPNYDDVDEENDDDDDVNVDDVGNNGDHCK